MGWKVLREFGDFGAPEFQGVNEDTQLSFRMLRKIWATLNTIENELNNLFGDDTEVDETADKFDEFDPVEDYEFGELVTKLRPFTNEAEWQRHVAMWKASNETAYLSLTHLFRWLLKAEVDSAGNKKAKFKINFKINPTNRFDFRIKRFDYHETPGHGQRKFHLDLEIDYVTDYAPAAARKRK